MAENRELLAARQAYRAAKGETEAAVTEYLLQCYREMTGKTPSRRFIDDLENLIHMELL
jgi:hypothetical protein